MKEKEKKKMSDNTTEEKFVDILTKKEHDEICAFLEEELRLAEAERAGEEEVWRTIRRQRWAKPEFEKKNTPWTDSSNVCPPGQLIATNTVFGMTKNIYGGKKPFWSIEAMRTSNREDIEIAKTLEKYLQLLADSRLDLDKEAKDQEIQEEADSLGTVFVKVPWTTEKHQVTLADGSRANAIFHDGPEWNVFPREDAYYRIRTKDIQKARWFAQAFELEEHEVEERFSSGEWTEWETWRDDFRSEAKPYEQEADNLSGGSPVERHVWDFFEVYIRWDLEPKDGFWEDLIVIFSRKAKFLPKVQVNPMGIRLIRQMNFIHRSFRLDGIGVGHAGMHMQAELEALHNNRINAVHMTTLKMFIGRRNSGIKERETLRPGKIFLVDKPAEDLRVLEMGEVYPSSLEAESNAWGYLQKATMMTDSLAGFADATLKSRDGLGMQANRMRASGGMIGAVLTGMDYGYSDLGMMTVYQLVWNKDTVMENERRIGRLSDEDLDKLEKALSIDIHEIPAKLRFSVRTADAEETFETRRQNVLTLWSIYNVYQKQMIPLMMQAAAGVPGPNGQMQPLPQEVKEFILRVSTGSSKIMEKIFEFFGEDETGDYIPPTKLQEFAFEMMDSAQEQMLRRLKNAKDQVRGGAGGPPAGQGGPSGIGPGPGMGIGTGNGQAAAGLGGAGSQGREGAPGAFPGTGSFQSL